MKKKLPIYKTSDDRARHLAAYEAMFSLWKIPHDSVDVKTGYGSTHINVSGPDDGDPLVLLHAAGLSSTAWFANIADLSADYRVYAIDIIGDAGKSTADCLMEKRKDYSWCLNLIWSHLPLPRLRKHWFSLSSVCQMRFQVLFFVKCNVLRLYFDSCLR